MFQHIVTDTIAGLQCVTLDRKQAEEFFEKCVVNAIANGHELYKDSMRYYTASGKEIKRNRGQEYQTTIEDENDFLSGYVCELCGDAIKESFGFCSRCKPYI